jgi:O-acetyl-ADP-ribose deacetylase
MISVSSASLRSPRPFRRCPECSYAEQGTRLVRVRRRRFMTRTKIAAEFVWSADRCPTDGNPLQEECDGPSCHAKLLEPTDTYCRRCGRRYWWMVETDRNDVAIVAWQAEEYLVERLGSLRVFKIRGSLAKIEADAVVSSDDIHGEMRGRSATALKSRGGEEIEAESRASSHAMGDAWKTRAGNLPVKHVIHVAVVHDDDSTTTEVIERAMRESLSLARANDLQSIAYPVLGTGRSGFLMKDSVPITRRVLVEFALGLTQPLNALFVMHAPNQLTEFEAAYESARALEGALPSEDSA